MIRCIAIDDEPAALDVIRSHAGRIPELELTAAFSDPLAAINYLKEQRVDLVFLDINMPDLNGLDLVQHFPYRPLIILTTAHSEYALAGYAVEAVDYLLKPFDFSRFLAAVQKVENRLSGESDPGRPYFFVSTGKQQRRLFYDQIRYVRGDGNYVHYHVDSDQVMVRRSLKEATDLLPTRQFVRIHRSYLVALRWIDRIADNHVYVADVRLPVGASFRDAFFRRIDQQGR